MHLRLKTENFPTMDHQRQFLRLFLAHESELRAYVGAVVGEVSAREDIFQETAMALWEHFGRYDPERRFGAWARGVATRKLQDFRRRRARAARLLSADAMEAVRQAFDRRDEMDETTTRRHHALHACLAGLPDASRQLLAWRYEDGLACAEISRRRGQSLDAIYQTLSRLRAALATCIEERLARAEADGPLPAEPLFPHSSTP